MKRFNVIALLSLVSLCLNAQTSSLLDRFYTSLNDSCIVMDMKYQIRMPGVKVDGSGILEFQDESWHLDGNGIEMWCDGRTVWTIDPESKEVVIEGLAEGESPEMMVNPAVLLVNIDKLFDLKETLPGKDGKTMLYILYPKGDSFVSFVNLELYKSDAYLKKTDFALDDGTSITVNVSSMNAGKKKPTGYFSQSVTYDSSWIVTDMR